jgi:hypothetical protein
VAHIILYRSFNNHLFESQIVPSAPPETLLLTVTSATEISVSWSEVPLIHQNGIITLYEVFYYPLEDYHNPLSMVQNTTELSFNLMGLHEFANYSIQVRAFTEVGPGPYSDQQFIRTDTAGTNEFKMQPLNTMTMEFTAICCIVAIILLYCRYNS